MAVEDWLLTGRHKNIHLQCQIGGWVNKDGKNGLAIRPTAFGMSERKASERVDGLLLGTLPHVQTHGPLIDNAC